MSSTTDKKFSAATLLAQALGRTDPDTRAVVLPMHPATTYLRDPDNQYSTGRIYSRADNPTYEPVEALLCQLENGADALVFGSGMAAATAVFQALQPGDHIIAPKVMYWALRNWLQQFTARWQLTLDFVDMRDLQQLEQAIQPRKTRLIWIETPDNPLWQVSDIEAIASLAKAHGCLTAVDSTCATPLLTQPLNLGADIVMHSATKYLNGHSDVIAGALISKVDSPFWQTIRSIRAQQGAVLSPRDAHELLRGMRTLHLRVRESCQNALYLATALQANPLVAEVLYPGLPEHPDHALAQRQMQGGFGGMLSVRLKHGAEAAIGVAARTKLWKRATSLGGVESLIEHRASIEGEGTPVPADLLRLSAGIETAQELLEDFEQALELAVQNITKEPQ
ncbi:trans-sulfuration enzyme family protein [Pseudidiomarina taiwanensis]|uniref:Cystathionine gamma-synthase n=1 Tax=Pseudidiomarina taiwanensis TaxID=337250 RepID=A0A432ZNM5_9GAMM|nr:PLP-dependent aspartate aminotransferase family protein [Pseudidiomarina taiwanensis]RUO79473.1 cystathionine gamma-synthase [Pseudidiomarina taiwanensis]